MKFENTDSGTLIELVDELREHAISTNGILSDFGYEIDLKKNGAKMIEDITYELGIRAIDEWLKKITIPAK